jgi:hypothetical protein
MLDSGGRYAAGFFLQLPARTPVLRWTLDCRRLVNETLTD